MAEQVELAFLRAARRLLPPGGSVLAAVSGGGDSVALLHLLRRYAERWRIRLGVAHLDHGLRRGSQTDRRFVEHLARSLALPVFADSASVTAEQRRDESLEEAARRVRRSFLRSVAQAEGFEHIATGHNLDDQAETIVMRLVRGGGATALTGMPESGAHGIVRPLIAIERSELRDWLQRHGHAFRDDPTNDDLQFDRNRTRRVVLPLLAEALNPRAARHLVQAAGRLREDAAFLDRLAESACDSLAISGREGQVRLAAESLAALEPVIAARVARLLLERGGVDPRRISSRHVAGLLDLARGGSGRELHLPGRRRARCFRKQLKIERAPLGDGA